MTDQQIQAMSTKQLLEAYKNKACCRQCQVTAYKLIKALTNRIDKVTLAPLKLATMHLHTGEGPLELFIESNKLIRLQECVEA